jgi:hypothetical protein
MSGTIFDSLDATEKKKRDRKRIKKKKPKQAAPEPAAAPATRPARPAAAAPVAAAARPAPAPAAAAAVAPARAQAPPLAAAAAAAPAPARASASSAIGKLETVTRNYLDGAVTLSLLPQILQSVAKYLNQNMSQARAFLESDVMLNVVTILVHLSEGNLELDAQQTRDSLKLGDAIVSILLPDADVELHMHLQRNLRDVLAAVGKLSDVPVRPATHACRRNTNRPLPHAHPPTHTHNRYTPPAGLTLVCREFYLAPRRPSTGPAVRAVHRRLLPRGAAPSLGHVCSQFFLLLQSGACDAAILAILTTIIMNAAGRIDSRPAIFFSDPDSFSTTAIRFSTRSFLRLLLSSSSSSSLLLLLLLLLWFVLLLSSPSSLLSWSPLFSTQGCGRSRFGQQGRQQQA